MKTALCSKWFGLTQANLRNNLGLILLGAVIAGCSGGKPEKIVMLGSNTIGEELAPRLVAEYKKEHPTVAFELEFKGTTYGIGALIVGRCDIAAASRNTSTNEVELARDRGVEFNDYTIGAYDVAVIVNGGSPVGNLTREQVRDLFTGAVQNWKDVGGPDAPVHLCIRHPISGTYLGFQELAMENKPYALRTKTFTNYTELVQAVATGCKRNRLLNHQFGQQDRRQAGRRRRSRPHCRSCQQRPISVRARPAPLHRQGE